MRNEEKTEENEEISVVGSGINNIRERDACEECEQMSGREREIYYEACIWYTDDDILEEMQDILPSGLDLMHMSGASDADWVRALDFLREYCARHRRKYYSEFVI